MQRLPIEVIDGISGIRGTPYIDMIRRSAGSCLCLFLILILSICINGCSPPQMSLLLKEDIDPHAIRTMTYDAKYHWVPAAYSVERLNDRFSVNEVSRIKTILADGQDIPGDSVIIRLGAVNIFHNGNVKQEYELSKVNRFILYSKIPVSQRLEYFFLPVLCCSVFGAVRTIDSKEINDVAIGALVGLVLGLPSLFNKEREAEKILNLYNKEVESKTEY